MQTKKGTVRTWILALLALCFTASLAFAGEKVACDDFSLELPEGWKTLQGPNKHPWGSIAIFAGSRPGEIVIVNITSTMGLGVEELINAAKKKAEQRGKALTIIRSDKDGYIAESANDNMTLRMISSVDAENKQLGILSYAAGNTASEAVAKTVKAKNPKLVFFR